MKKILMPLLFTISLLATASSYAATPQYGFNIYLSAPLQNQLSQNLGGGKLSTSYSILLNKPLVGWSSSSIHYTSSVYSNSIPFAQMIGGGSAGSSLGATEAGLSIYHIYYAAETGKVTVLQPAASCQLIINPLPGTINVELLPGSQLNQFTCVVMSNPT